MTVGTAKSKYLKMRKNKLGDSTIILVGQEETKKITRYGLFGQLKFNVKCYIIERYTNSTEKQLNLYHQLQLLLHCTMNHDTIICIKLQNGSTLEGVSFQLDLLELLTFK